MQLFNPMVTEIIETKTSLPFDLIVRMSSSPYYWSIIFCRLIIFNALDGKELDKNQSLNKGDKFLGCQPLLEDNSWSTYEIKECQVDHNAQSVFVKIELIKPGKKNTCEKMEIILTHTSKTDGCSVSELQLAFSPVNPFGLEVTKMIYKQAAHRLRNILINPDLYLKEFEVSGLVSVNYYKNSNFHSLPYEVGTSVVLPRNKYSVTNLLMKKDLINCLLSIEAMNEPTQDLSIKDKFEITMDNMQLTKGTLVRIKEKVVYTIVKCDENRIELISDTGLANFHQFGCKIAFENGSNENETEIHIAIYYHRSTAIGVAQGFRKFSTLFTDKIPDPSLLLFLRARNMLDSFVRHLQRYVEKNLHIDLCATKEKMQTISYER